MMISLTINFSLLSYTYLYTYLHAYSISSVENVVRVFRSCGWYDASTEQPTCIQRTGSLGFTQTQCVCRGDLCNQGIISQQSTSTITLLITIISLGYIKKIINFTI